MCFMGAIHRTILLGLSFLAPVDASTSLRRAEPGAETTGAEALQQQRAILAELEEALGSEHRRATEARLGQIEDALRPTCAASPQGR